MNQALEFAYQQNNPEYCELRAMELIDEARLHSGSPIDYNDCIRQAISLLTIARIQREEKRS